jgi:hypothetical protein
MDTVINCCLVFKWSPVKISSIRQQAQLKLFDVFSTTRQMLREYHTHILSQCRPQPHLTTQLHFTTVQGTAASYQCQPQPHLTTQLHFTTVQDTVASYQSAGHSCILPQYKIQLHLITMHTTAAQLHLTTVHITAVFYT